MASERDRRPRRFAMEPQAEASKHARFTPGRNMLRRAGVDLSRIGGSIPFLGTLLKTEQDLQMVRAKA